MFYIWFYCLILFGQSLITIGSVDILLFQLNLQNQDKHLIIAIFVSIICSGASFISRKCIVSYNLFVHVLCVHLFLENCFVNASYCYFVFELKHYLVTHVS